MNLNELVVRIVRQTLRQLRVSMPARVVSYDAARSMAQVEIVQPEREADGTLTAQPVIAEVPVSWMRAGGASITFPLRRGDTGLLVFSDRDIGGWVSDNDASAPDSDRQHSITDAVFIPGIQGGGVQASADDVVIQYAGASVTITQGGDVNVTGGNVMVEADSAVISADALTIDAVTEHNGNITVAGNLTVNGTIQGTSVRQGGVILGTHTHSGVTTGAGVSGPPVGA